MSYVQLWIESYQCILYNAYLLERTGRIILSLWNSQICIGYEAIRIYKHKILNPLHPLMRGFDDRFYAPHSRHTTIMREDVDKHDDLLTLSISNDAGIYIVAEKSGRQFFITGHAEYDRDTLANEYYRDEVRGLNPELPENYFPDDDRRAIPHFMWRSHANLLFQNWLNYYVYQQTPFDLKDLITLEKPQKKS